VFGSNKNGQLGLGAIENSLNPTKIPNFKAKSVVASAFHTLAISPNDDVWGFGNNEYYQLGLGDPLNRLVPTKIPNFKAKQLATGYRHTVAITSNYNL
jgi:alpha-tubulin suppressor-like RCC1 family protein